MSRQARAGLALLLMAAVACSISTPSPQPAATEFHPSTDTRLEAGEHRFTELTIPTGVTVTLDGDVVVNVEGPIHIDGTVTGDCTAVEIRGTEDLTLDGLISNTCASDPEARADVRLVAVGDIILGTTVSDEPAIVSDGDIWISDPGGEDLDLTPVVFEESSSGWRSTPGLAAAARPGTDGTIVFDEPVIISNGRRWVSEPAGEVLDTAQVLRDAGETRIRRPVRAGRGKTYSHVRQRGSFAIDTDPSQVTPGEDAPHDTQDGTCDNSNKIGGTGGSVRLGTGDGTLTIADGVTLAAGNGGKGGSCTAKSGCPAIAIAGPGGRGGSVLLGGGTIILNGGVTVKPGDGGPGGDAKAIADAGTDDCADGCEATATGGKGGDAGGLGYLFIEPGGFGGRGSIAVDGRNGGKGGSAEAEGGDGTDCPTCPGGKGGKGGDATATGGQGGNGGSRGISGWKPAQNSHLKGDGGDATASGGKGGKGATCCNPPQKGGDGGAGGKATATGGQIGARGLGGGGSRGSSGGRGGDGGDGGDGKPPGKGGEGGEGVGDPDPVPAGDKGKDGQRCMKVWIIWVRVLVGGHVELPAEGCCVIHWLILIVTDDPVPVPDATVTIRMTHPDGSSETSSAVTGPDGIASGSFKIYAHGDYTLAVENVEAEDMVYDPTLNRMDSIVVGSAHVPLPDPATVIVGSFLEDFVAAMRSGDIDFLLEHLYPEVTEIYGDEQCRAYLETVTDPAFDIDVLGVSEPGPWQWEIDDRTTSIADAYTVNVSRTSRGETSTLEMHLAPDDEGRVSWFTDCGDPSP